MIGLLRFVFAVLVWPFTSQARLHAEIAVLRQQVIVLQRKSSGRVRLSNADRWSSSSSIACFLRSCRRSTSSVRRRWFAGIEQGFAAIGAGSRGIGEGARRSI